MLKNHYKVLGVMSGTSLDGIDIVECDFRLEQDWSFQIINADTVSYDQYWTNRLKDLSEFDLTTLLQIDGDYTKYLANQVTSFIEKFKIKEIDYVCSHGHTAKHRPSEGTTYQIGNLPELADYIGLPVVCNFRKQDVKYGGQGAPLVPIGDELLFNEYQYCLNLGGFSNVSFSVNNRRIAYDVCPVNIVLNYYALKLNLPYDGNGEIAASGRIHEELLEELNSLEYYREKWPKSLGVEWVNEKVIPLINSYKLEIKDNLRTICEHIAIQIGKLGDASALILSTGGGAYNKFLMERIEAYSRATIYVPDSEIVEYKEALIFGFLGVLKVRNEINCLKSVTGAIRDHSSGQIYYPKIAIT